MGTRTERVRKRCEFARHGSTIVDACRDDPTLAAFMTKLDNAVFDLFLCAVEAQVPPMNGPAKKLLRGPVIVRRILGAIDGM